MRDLIFLGLTAAFYALTVWLVAFADRIMPVASKRELPLGGRGQEDAS